MQFSVESRALFAWWMFLVVLVDYTMGFGEHRYTRIAMWRLRKSTRKGSSIPTGNPSKPRFGFAGPALLVGLATFAIQQGCTVTGSAPSWEWGTVWFSIAIILVILAIWFWDETAAHHRVRKSLLSVLIVTTMGSFSYIPVAKQYRLEHPVAQRPSNPPPKPGDERSLEAYLRFYGINHPRLQAHVSPVTALRVGPGVGCEHYTIVFETEYLEAPYSTEYMHCGVTMFPVISDLRAYAFPLGRDHVLTSIVGGCLFNRPQPELPGNIQETFDPANNELVVTTQHFTGTIVIDAIIGLHWSGGGPSPNVRLIPSKFEGLGEYEHRNVDGTLIKGDIVFATHPASSSQAVRE